MFKHNFTPIFMIHLNTATAVFKGNRKYSDFFFMFCLIILLRVPTEISIRLQADMIFVFQIMLFWGTKVKHHP